MVTLIFSSTRKFFELGKHCNIALLDDRSKAPVRVYPLGTSSRTPGVHLRVITRWLKIVQQKFVAYHVYFNPKYIATALNY